ncbi:hypothetical protein BGX26_002331 [Mortierella sp. AD094]|nr:hypothetical protein BGX26_002331 [Mortierella sp. AD094]
MGNRIRRPFNIILIGETQSGKSTFAEALKLYANPNYKIQERLIGNGTFSQTTKVREDTIHTNLPVFGVFNESSELITHEKFIIDNDRDDYEDFLNKRRGLKVNQIRSETQMYDFTIIDTPGLNDTYSEDEEHVAKIFSKLQDSRAINLVVVLVANGPFTPGFVSAIKGYIDLFPELDNILAFVHTKVDYKYLHPECIQFSKRHKLKKETLNDLMGRSTFPHFVIDCDLKMAKPVRNCITQNTIHKILELAYWNVPVSILPSRMINKTPKMIEVDKIITSRSRSILTATEDTLKFKDEDEGVLLNSIYSHETAIAELGTKMRNNQDLLCNYNTDELELLYEERFTDEHQLLPASRVKEFRFPAQGHQEYKIDKLVQWPRFFAPRIVNGGEGTPHWRCIYTKENSDWSGYYHIKIYVERRNRYNLEIKRLEQELIRQQEELEDLRQEKDKHNRQFREERLKIQQLIDSHSRQMQLIRFTSAAAIKSDIFYKLLIAKAYVGPENVCSKTAEKIYMDLIREQERSKSLPGKPLENPFSLLQDEAPVEVYDHQHDPPQGFQDSKEKTEAPVKAQLTPVQTQLDSQSTGAKDRIEPEKHEPAANADFVKKKPKENYPSVTNVNANSKVSEPLPFADVNVDSEAQENVPSVVDVDADSKANENTSVENTNIDSKAQENVPSVAIVNDDSKANETPSIANVNVDNKAQGNVPSVAKFNADGKANKNPSVANINIGSKAKENDPPVANTNLDSDIPKGKDINEYIVVTYIKQSGEVSKGKHPLVLTADPYADIRNPDRYDPKPKAQFAGNALSGYYGSKAKPQFTENVSHGYSGSEASGSPPRSRPSPTNYSTTRFTPTSHHEKYMDPFAPGSNTFALSEYSATGSISTEFTTRSNASVSCTQFPRMQEAHNGDASSTRRKSENLKEKHVASNGERTSSLKALSSSSSSLHSRPRDRQLGRQASQPIVEVELRRLQESQLRTLGEAPKGGKLSRLKNTIMGKNRSTK